MNKKVLPIIVGVTLTSLLASGCNNINTLNTNKERIANTSNISKDKELEYYQKGVLMYKDLNII